MKKTESVPRQLLSEATIRTGMASGDFMHNLSARLSSSRIPESIRGHKFKRNQNMVNAKTAELKAKVTLLDDKTYAWADEESTTRIEFSPHGIEDSWRSTTATVAGGINITDICTPDVYGSFVMLWSEFNAEGNLINQDMYPVDNMSVEYAPADAAANRRIAQDKLAEFVNALPRIDDLVIDLRMRPAEDVTTPLQ